MQDVVGHVDNTGLHPRAMKIRKYFKRSNRSYLYFGNNVEGERLEGE